MTRGSRLLGEILRGTLYEPSKRRVGLFKEFGVPLHGEHVMTGKFHRFDHAIGSRGGDHEIVAEDGQGLVVE